MNSRIPLLFNPTSGGGVSASLSQFLLKNSGDFSIYTTKSAKDSHELLKHFVDNKEPIVTVSGGDGSINQALEEILGSDTALGILPTGTMNVFAREVGISTTNFSKVLKIIQDKHILETDVFTLNGSPFIQMAGLGYDAHIIEQTSTEDKIKLGPLAYAQSLAKVFGSAPPQMHIETAEGQTEEGVCVLLGNGKLYGGQVSLFEKARNTDGLIDALVIKSSGYQAVLDLGFRIMSGEALDKIPKTENISYLQSASLKITSSKEIPYELDGEYYGRSKSFIISKDARSLRVLAPKEKPQSCWNEKLSALWSLTPLK